MAFTTDRKQGTHEGVTVVVVPAFFCSGMSIDERPTAHTLLYVQRPRRDIQLNLWNFNEHSENLSVKIPVFSVSDLYDNAEVDLCKVHVSLRIHSYLMGNPASLNTVI